MTSAQHRRWINSGLTWTLAFPLAYLRDRLQRYGYVVYDIGNTEHLDHIPPEDHTPYSETGWPGTTPYGWVTAIDVMPNPTLPSLQALGAQLYTDKEAGIAGFIKYMNWGPNSDAHAVHDSWEPNHARESSTDTGHIHVSCRSDYIASTDFNAYDPIARLKGIMPLRSDDMYVGLANGARYAVGPKGPVLVTWEEWVASGFDHEPPHVLILADETRLKDFTPEAASAVAQVQSPVKGTVTLDFPTA